MSGKDVPVKDYPIPKKYSSLSSILKDMRGPAVNFETIYVLIKYIRSQTVINLTGHSYDQNASFDMEDLDNLLITIKGKSNIKALNFYGLPLGNEGTLKIADYLSSEDNPPALYLQHTNIGDEGLIALLNSLQPKRVPIHLCVGDNPVSDKSLLAIVVFMHAHPFKSSLFLGSNHDITHEGQEAILRALNESEVVLTFGISQKAYSRKLAILHALTLSQHNVVDESEERWPSLFLKGEEGAPPSP